MKTRKLTTMMLAVALIVSMSMTTASAADMPTDPIGGKPAAGSKPSITDLDYQVKYHRAFEAVLWSMPAVGIYGFHKAPVTLGGGANTILGWSKPAKPNSELLTANNVTPYLVSQTDLSKGLVVVEVPAATDKASLYGQIVDHWQISIADVGPSGVDKGKGGKLLLTIGLSTVRAQGPQARGGEGETRLGKLEFKSDYVTEETAAKLREELRFQAAVQTYLWGFPIANVMSLRDGHRAVGIKNTSIPGSENRDCLSPTGSASTQFR
ncbi:MAG: DUF1254 domain-containing protein [Planctomycetota bacterium]|jgi:hypothetical protein